MNFEIPRVLQIIQLMLAPAVMISACGLLLLGINNKYSLVANRIRLLNEEKRKLLLSIGERPPGIEENIRFESLAKQIDSLFFRIKLVRNSVLFYTAAVALFVVTSLMLGLSYFITKFSLDYVILAAFLLGMVCVLIGVVFAGFETKKGYDIIEYEVTVHE